MITAGLAKVLDYNWFIVGCLIIKKWDDNFPGENSHLITEQTTRQFQTIDFFVHSGG